MLPTDKLDQLFDHIIYAVIVVCFASAIIFIINAVVDSLSGWYPVTNHLYNAGILIVFGIVVSVFLFWIKSQDRGK